MSIRIDPTTDALTLARPAPPPAARAVMPYVLGIALIVGAHGVAILVRTPNVPAGYTVFVAAVVLTALYGGFGPGLLVVALASLDLTSLVASPNFMTVTPTADPTLIAACSAAALLAGGLRRPRARPVDHAVLLAATERERRRIGNDLHDGLGQELAGLSMMTSALAEKLKAEGSPSAQQAGELAGLVRESIRHAADLARGLSPADLADGELVLALQRLCDRVGRLPGVACAFVHRGDECFSADEAVHLYRIAQEAVSNALKHGRARRLTVSLNATDGGLTLRIADDGRGFDAALAEGGLGLRLMALRAEAVGGTLVVGPRATGGTVVTCHAGPEGN